VTRPTVTFCLLASAFIAACGADPLADVIVDDDPSVPLSICLNGAGSASHPGNLVVEDLCAGLPGIVQDCVDADCRATFRPTDGARVAEIIKALRASESDTRPLHLLGYSLGGVNVLDVAKRLHDDTVLDDEASRVERLVVIDPFAPFLPEPLDVADNVRAFWSYRHSIAPEDDCSADRPLIGPYEGKRPRCLDGTPCLDFDWSLFPEGRDVDHCTVTDRSAPAVRLNLVEGADATRYVPLPPTVAVERRALEDIR
jgi:pimeloyl-ACP methyl ester carboxylesterase